MAKKNYSDVEKAIVQVEPTPFGDRISVWSGGHASSTEKPTDHGKTSYGKVRAAGKGKKADKPAARGKTVLGSLKDTGPGKTAKKPAGSGKTSIGAPAAAGKGKTAKKPSDKGKTAHGALKRTGAGHQAKKPADRGKVEIGKSASEVLREMAGDTPMPGHTLGGAPRAGLVIKAGGEGSRGGTVIGHTATGKPIYAGRGRADHRRLLADKFDRQEKLHSKTDYASIARHGVDFASLSEDQRNALNSLPHISVTDAGHDVIPQMAVGAQHGRVEFIAHHPEHGSFYVNTEGYDYARYKTPIHNYNSFKWPRKTKKAHGEADVQKAGRGEGSRGGKVIGHTRSGKPIYGDAAHVSHGDFSKQDWLDAGKAFSNHGAKHHTAQRRGNAQAALAGIDHKSKVHPTGNKEWGFHGTAAMSHGQRKAKELYGHAQRALAAVHEGVGLEQARNFLDSRAGRHMADGLAHLTKPTKEDVHDVILQHFHSNGPVDNESRWDVRHSEFHPDNWEG